MNRRIVRAAVSSVVSAAVLVACATPGPPPPSDLQSYRVETNMKVEQATTERRVAYAYEGKPKTIAFFPPASCRAISDVTKGSDARGNLVHDDCGVLLTLLEEGAVAAGLEVVSWRNLVGDQRALDYAREAKVDMLVEINELSDNDPVAAKAGPQLSQFKLIEARGSGDVTATPPSGLQEKCGASLVSDWNMPALAINAKFVSVSDGRVRGNYRNRLAMIPLTDVHVARKFDLPQVTGAFPNTEKWFILGAGVGVLGLGGLVAIPALLAASNGVDVVSSSDPIIITSFVGGLLGVLAGAGIALYGLLLDDPIMATYADETGGNVCAVAAPVDPPSVDTRDNRNKTLERIAKDLVDVVVAGVTQ